MNLRIQFLKILRLFEFFKFRSRLWHCIIPDRTKYFFKKLGLVLQNREFYILLEEHSEFFTGINLKRHCGDSFCRIYKNKIFSCTNDGAEQNINTILCKSFDTQTTKNHLQSLQYKKRTRIKKKISQNGYYLCLYSRRSNEVLGLIKIQTEVKEKNFKFICRASIYYGIINLLWVLFHTFVATL